MGIKGDPNEILAAFARKGMYPVERTARQTQRGEYVLTIPGWHPTPLNKLINCHWGTAAKRKKKDRQTIAFANFDAGIPPATGKRRVTIRIVLGKGQRACDPDAYQKTTLDSLVACNLLRDDSRTWCELAPIEFERGKRATVIKLEDISC